MKKTIQCKFDPPLSWKEAMLITPFLIGNIVFVTSCKSMHVEAFKCSEEDYVKVSRELKKRKIAFVRKD